MPEDARSVAQPSQGFPVGGGSSALVRLLDRRGLPMRWRLGLLPAVAAVATAAALGHAARASLLAGLIAFAAGFLFARLTLWPMEAMCRRVEMIAAGDLSQRVNEPRGSDAAARLGRILNAMLGRLEAADLRQRRFISDAAHELRGPVAATFAVLETALSTGLESGPGPATHLAAVDASIGAVTEVEPRLRMAAQHALGEQRRLARLVDDLLLLATSDEGGAELRQIDVDLDDALEAAAAIRALGRVNVDTTGIGAARLQGDPHLLATVVRNLLDNAERHARSSVAVALFATSEHVTLTVDDDGPGIPPLERERVFERFSQLQSARTASGGAGLGLALVRSICERHGGTVLAETSPLGGARFTAVFPI